MGTPDLTEIIKTVGRGSAGARPLDRAGATALFGAMLEGEVPELELGAIVLCYRIKGETTDELAGFLDAIHARITRIAAPRARPTIVIPTYNGARHLPNLVPLLALLLRDAGFAVLVHGVSNDPKRVMTGSILAALDVPPARDPADAAARLAADGIAYIPIEALAPGFARILDLRWRLGVRGSAHTLAKMLQPVRGPALQLVSVTHPEYFATMRDYYAAHPASVMLLRGTEGEAVAHSRRPQAIEWLHEGAVERVVEAVEGSVPSLPELPAAIDAATTAEWIRGAIAGRHPVPPAIRAQVDAIRRILARV